MGTDKRQDNDAQRHMQSHANTPESSRRSSVLMPCASWKSTRHSRHCSMPSQRASAAVDIVPFSAVSSSTAHGVGNGKGNILSRSCAWLDGERAPNLILDERTNSHEKRNCLVPPKRLPNVVETLIPHSRHTPHARALQRRPAFGSNAS